MTYLNGIPLIRPVPATSCVSKRIIIIVAIIIIIISCVGKGHTLVLQSINQSLINQPSLEAVVS